MRVVVNENVKVFHGHKPVRLAAGQEVSGELAAMLLERASGKVTRLDTDQGKAKSVEDEPLHRAPCEDGSVCGGPHCPPEQKTPSEDGDGPDHPGPSAELDITASASKVLDWVGEDRERAAQALAAEEAAEKPRSTLVKQLKKLTADD